MNHQMLDRAWEQLERDEMAARMHRQVTPRVWQRHIENVMLLSILALFWGVMVYAALSAVGVVG